MLRMSCTKNPQYICVSRRTIYSVARGNRVGYGELLHNHYFEELDWANLRLQLLRNSRWNIFLTSTHRIFSIAWNRSENIWFRYFVCCRSDHLQSVSSCLKRFILTSPLETYIWSMHFSEQNVCIIGEHNIARHDLSSLKPIFVQ